MKKIQLKIAGKTLTASLGLGFLGTFLKDEGMEMAEFDKAITQNPIYYLPKVLYHAVKLNAFLEGESEPKESDILKLILSDDGGILGDEMMKFQEALGESMQTNLPQGNVKKVGKPKK